ncbi:hypothetical protein CO709_04245 [Burkholderia thailandensis]|nr:hypothetical protein CO709_04245 [Burkholderia thailandensis]
MIVWGGAAQHKSRVVREYLDTARMAPYRWPCCPVTRPI